MPAPDTAPILHAAFAARRSEPLQQQAASGAPAAGGDPTVTNGGAAWHKRQALVAEYRTRAADQTELAQGATLVQVREKHEEAAGRWRLLAEGEEQRGLMVRDPGVRAQRRSAGLAREAASCTA